MKQTTLLAVACLVGGASLFGADPQLLNMAPSDAQMFAGINVEQAKTSPFGQFLLANIPTSTEFQDFIHSTGFDPRTDLREVLVVTSGAPGMGVEKKSHSGLVMAKGTFNIPQILAAAAKDGKATVTSYAGVQLVTISGGNESQALGLIDAATVVAGGSAEVKTALDQRTRANAIPADVMARINQLSTTEDAWSVSTANFGALPIPGSDDKAGSAVLKSIQQASGGVKFGTVVQLDAQAVTGSTQDATSLGDVVRLLAQMVQMHSSKDSVPGQITDLLKSLVVSVDQNILKVTLSLPEDQLETLFKMAESHHGDQEKI
jgi:hypothetical protein